MGTPAKTHARKTSTLAPLHTPRASRQVEFFETQISRVTADSAVRVLLTVEASANLPKTVPQLLLDTGFDLVRTNNVERAKAALRAIQFEGMVLVLKDAENDRATTSLELLSSTFRPPLVAVICDGEMHADVSEIDARVFSFNDVRHPRRRTALTDYFRGVVKSPTVAR